MGEALERWQLELEAWAIPPEILERAPESPWGFPVEAFRGRAERASGRPTPSNHEALRWLPEGGTVLDVGAGTGAASLPLARRAARLVAVDESATMLDAFADLAAAAGVPLERVVGHWPEAAGQVPAVDVVVCHNVLYNVADLAPFAGALSEHARVRVVAEISERHPLVNLGPLWRHFHGLDRPEGPDAAVAVAALRELGIPVERHDWQGGPTFMFERFEDAVAFTRRRLCLEPEHDAELATWLRDQWVEGERGWRQAAPSHRVVLSWPGTASR